MADQQDKFDSEILERDEKKVKEPEMYKVVIHNDDFTTKDFVVHILRVVFHKEPAEATRIMLHVHKRGRGVVGVYTWDIAQTRAQRVHQMAKEAEYPLKCTVEEA